MELKRLVIVGAGAIGGSIGGMLANAGLPVIFVARGTHGAKICTDGITVKFPDRTINVSPTCLERIDQVNWLPGDVALIATKLNDAQDVMNQLVDQVGTQLPVVCATNGMQGEIWASEKFKTVLSMLVWMPSTHLVPGEVSVYGENCPGVLDVGPTLGEMAALLSDMLCDWLRESGFDSESRIDIKRWKYAKWITNLGNTAQALVTDDWKSVAQEAQAEGEQVLTIANVSRVATSELLDRTSHIKLKSIDGKRRPGGSTWQSFRRGKPLESQWIEGAMAELAESVGEAAPLNQYLATIARESRQLFAEEVFEALKL